MVKKVIILLFLLPFILFGIFSTIFLYSEQTQSYLINTFNIKNVLNNKVKSFISQKINDESISVNIGSIKILKPKWPFIARLEFNDINVTSISQKDMSNINLVQLGFSYENLLKNIFLDKDRLELSYLNFKDLTLNVNVEKNKISPGPLLKILSSINQISLKNQQSIKNLLQNEIKIGNIILLLSDNREPSDERLFKINCKNVLVSKYLKFSRSLNMNCNQNSKLRFSLNATLDNNFNSLNVNVENLDIKPVLGKWLKKILKPKTDNIYVSFHGSFNIITDNYFDIQSFKLSSKNSSLIIKNNNNDVILNTYLNGKLFWNKQDNLLKFNKFAIGNAIVGYSQVDLNTKVGILKLNIKKLSTSEFKRHLSSFRNYYNQFINLNFLKSYNDKFKEGNLNNADIQLKFSFFKNFYINHITGRSYFTNIILHHSDKIFKKLICTISGNLKFRLESHNNKLINDQSWVEVHLDAFNGYISSKQKILEYKFDKAKIITKLHNGNNHISSAQFFNNQNLEYSFKDIRINKRNYEISNAIFFKNNKIRYEFEDIKINNNFNIKSFLKIKNNFEFSDYLKKKLNIQLHGDIDLNFKLSGKLKTLDFNLKLNSDLTNSFLNINYLDIIKKKNDKSSIISEIIYRQGKLAFIKNTILKTEKNNYEIEFINFNHKFSNRILFKNVKTSLFDLNQILISKVNKKINVLISGNKINLSNFKNKLNKKFNSNYQIYFDITADKIILYPKISLAGNLKGSINKSIFESTAFGQMSLDKSSLLDSGKFKIYSDDKISKLSGIGLIGGAETKVSMKKNENQLPQISFDTSDGGKLLKALGFTENIKSGEMKVKINFLNNEYNHYKGTIKSRKFSLINAPGIINSLSVLSFSGIRSVITGEGVFFDKGQADIMVKNKFFNFDKVYLSSQSLGIAARGTVNLKNKSVEMAGSVAPIKLISRIISVVPAVGQLITGMKKEGLFAGQFKMVGAIENPKVELNTLSFAPGILRDIFADDWLDKDNFFLKNGLN